MTPFIDFLYTMVTGVLAGYIANGTGGFLKKFDNRKIQKQIEKKVHQQLNRFSKSVPLLYNDPDFLEYFKNYDVADQIAKHIIGTPDTAGTSTNSFLNRITEETVQALRNQGKTVSVMDEYEILHLYQEIAQVMGNVYLDMVPPQEKFMFRRQEELIRHSFGQLFSKLQKQNDPPLSLTLSHNPQTAMPQIYRNGSEKSEIVRKITEALRHKTWIHIYGKRLCGKTQVMLRVMEVIGESHWLDGTASNLEQILDNSWNFKKDEVIFLDNIPSLTDPITANMLMGIYDKCKKEKAHIITSGYEPCEKICMAYGETEKPLDIFLDGFTEKEVTQLLIRAGAPEEFLHSREAALLICHTKSSPAVVMEGIYRLKQSGWVMDDPLFMDILGRRTEHLEQDQEQVLLSEVKDEQSRQLLYRMAYMGHPVERSYMAEVAAVEQAITPLDEKLKLLQNRWITMEGNQYSCETRLFSNAAKENLTIKQKEALDRIAIEMLTQNPLDELHFTYYISHLSNLKEYGALVISCVKVMEQAMEEDRKDVDLSVEHFWIEQPFPGQMEPNLRCLFVMEQLYYKTWKYGGTLEQTSRFGKKAIQCLKHASSEQRDLGICSIMMNTARISMIHPSSGLELFTLLTKEYTWDTLTHADREFHVLENDFNGFSCGSLLELLLVIFIMDIDSLDAFRQLWHILMELPSEEQLKQIDQTQDMAALIPCMVERVRQSLKTDSTPLDSCVEEWYEFADAHGLSTMKTGLLNSRLYGLHLQNKYEKAVELFESYQTDIQHAPYQYVGLIDMMARIAHDNADTEREKELFHTLFSIVSAHPDEDAEYTLGNSYIMYLSVLEPQECEAEETRLLAQRVGRLLEKKYGQTHLVTCAEEQLEAEYWLRLYLLGVLDTHVEEFAGFLQKLLKKETQTMKNTTAQQNALAGILARCTHWLGYIYGHDICHKKLMLGNEDYAIPSQYMFYHQEKDKEIIAYWYPYKRSVLLFALCQYAHYCGKGTLADQIFHCMLKENLEGNPHIPAYFSIDSLMVLQLLRGQYWNQWKKIFVQSMVQTEKDNADFPFLLINRMIFAVAAYVRSVYITSQEKAKELCSHIAQVLTDSSEELKSYQTYLGEAARIFHLIAEEGADYWLLSHVAEHLKARPDTQELVRAIYPVFLIDTPKNTKQTMDINHQLVMQEYHMTDDFGLQTISMNGKIGVH